MFMFKIRRSKSVMIELDVEGNVILAIDAPTLNIADEMDSLIRKMRDQGMSEEIVEVIDRKFDRMIFTELSMEIVRNHIAMM